MQNAVSVSVGDRAGDLSRQPQNFLGRYRSAERVAVEYVAIIIGSGAMTLAFFGRKPLPAEELAVPSPAAPAELRAERRELAEALS